MKFLNLLEFGPPPVTQIPRWVPLDDLSFRACPHGPTSIGAARAAIGAHSALDPAKLPADVGVTDLLELPLGGSPSKLPRTLLEPIIFPGESGVQGGTKYQAKSVEIYSSDALQVGRKSFTMSWTLEKGGNRRPRGAPNYDDCSRAHGRTRANGLRGRSPARQPTGSRRGRECLPQFRNRLAEILLVCGTALQPCASGAACHRQSGVVIGHSRRKAPAGSVGSGR